MLKQIFNFRRENLKTLATGFIFFAMCFFCPNQTLEAQTTAFTYLR